jgi:hypothetical protein
MGSLEKRGNNFHHDDYDNQHSSRTDDGPSYYGPGSNYSGSNDNPANSSEA